MKRRINIAAGLFLIPPAFSMIFGFPARIAERGAGGEAGAESGIFSFVSVRKLKLIE